MTPLEILNEALKAWRKTRNPRFAVLAELATKRALPEPRPLIGSGAKKADTDAWLKLLDQGDVLDVPRLVEAVGGARSQVAADRLLLLAKLDDPRVGSGVLTTLEKPPYRARTAMPFFRACAKVLGESNDPRAREAMLDLASRFKTIVDTSVGDDVALLLRRTAEGLDQVKPGPLPAAVEKKAGELEAMFESERSQLKRTATAAKTSQQSDDALLAAIYAAPDDDGPRLVYADALTERGDPRGEFIALQIQHARGTKSPSTLRRERELLGGGKNKAEWSFPLSQGGDCRFARGFPEHLALQAKTAKTIVGNPALRTLKALEGLNRGLAQKTGKALLEHDSAKHLHKVGALPRELLEKLDGDFPWPALGVDFIPTAQELARFPRLTALEAHQGWGQQLDSAAFVGMSRLKSLEAIGVGADLFAHLPNLTRLRFMVQVEGAVLKPMLAPLTKLTSLQLGWVPEPGTLPSSVTHLECNVRAGAPVRALIDSMPRLTELELGNASLALKELETLFTARESVARLERLDLGMFSFEEPWSENGVLTLRGLFGVDTELARIQATLSAMPEGLMQRVVLRPLRDDPHVWLPPEPEPARVEALGVSARVPISVEWY